MRDTARMDERDLKAIDTLVDDWCERRELQALREILSGWPLSSGLTDDYAQLLEALRSLRGVARDALTESELRVIERLIPKVEQLVQKG